jgi:pimeloyl-ACP methyl ester carboxylesterase
MTTKKSWVVTASLITLIYSSFSFLQNAQQNELPSIGGFDPGFAKASPDRYASEPDFILSPSKGTTNGIPPFVPTERSELRDMNRNDSLYFNTDFLVQYDLVAQTLLKEEQFKEVYFTTNDEVVIHGLWRFNPCSPYTIIFSAGFFPGRKEGLASFIKMVPQNCNILFFDARGHGKSTGRFFTNLANYGRDEHLDIIAAIEFVQKQTQLPIIIHGICAGAFHCAHALTALGAEKINQYTIKGFIFDSGIVSLENVIHVPQMHFQEKIIPNIFLSLYTNDTKHEVKERLLCKISSCIVTKFIAGITFFLKPSVKQHDQHIHLAQTIKEISCPVLLVHCKNDAYAPFAEVEKLACTIQNCTTWWIEQSEHAVHQLKHTKEYTKQLDKFIKSIL